MKDTLTEVRTVYWLVGGRSQVKSFLYRCLPVQEIWCKITAETSSSSITRRASTVRRSVRCIRGRLPRTSVCLSNTDEEERDARESSHRVVYVCGHASGTSRFGAGCVLCCIRELSATICESARNSKTHHQ